MAHFAEISSEKKVIRVITVDNNELLDENGEEKEHLGVTFCQKLFGGTWVQTSYNANIRKHFACKGYTYRSELNAFVPPQPFESWVLDQKTCIWKAPVEMPDDGNQYYWNEEILNWSIVVDNEV